MGLVQRGTLIAVALAAYLVNLWPTPWVRDAVLNAFHHPPYEGVWILIPHVLLYTTLQALFCLAAWSILARLEWMPALRLSRRLSTIGWGLGVGLVSVALLVAFFFATGQAGAFHAPRVNPWIAAANIFSNFYEEYVFRGFILAALTAALGFWPAAIISSLAFGATHTQYPLSLQALIAALAVLWAWAGKRAGGLLAPYTAHMTLDWLIDPVL
ncbi:MAG: CPBP family intramembrane glutamic endopeptidase [Pseudomonadota bacterium]